MSGTEEVENVRVTPMPSARSKRTEAAKANPGAKYRTFLRNRMLLRIGGLAVVIGAIYYRIPKKPEERQLLKSMMVEYIGKKHDMKGVVDLEIYEELEAVGQLQRRKKWLGQPIPVVNEAARELGFDVERYAWNYDRRPPSTAWFHPTTVWYKFQRRYFYTPEEIEEIDRLYAPQP